MAKPLDGLKKKYYETPTFAIVKNNGEIVSDELRAKLLTRITVNQLPNVR